MKDLKERGDNHSLSAREALTIQKRLEVGFATASSESHPERNEDAMFANPERGIFGVFDGISSSELSHIASKSASEFMRAELEKLPPDEKLSSGFLEDALQEIFIKAARNIPQGNTTATVMKVWEENGQPQVTYGHLGDSRLYRFNNNRLWRLTEDDGVLLALRPSLARVLSRKFDLVKTKEDLDDRRSIPLDSSKEFTREFGDRLYTTENELFYRSNVLYRTLRRDSEQVKVGTEDVDRGDLLALTTDGIHHRLTSDEIARILQKYHNNPRLASRMFIEEAQEVNMNPFIKSANGTIQRSLRAGPDDKTVIVVGVK